MSVELIMKREWTAQDRLQASEAPGRPMKRVHGGWMADLAALRKSIVLCPFCTHKFNPKSHHYRKETDFPEVTGRCDGCKVSDARCTLYIAEELYAQVRMTRDDVRSMARRGFTMYG